MGAKHIKTQARKLNKYILYILIGLVLLMAIFAIPKTLMKAFAWVAPGDPHNFNNTKIKNGWQDDPITSTGAGNFPELPTMTISNVGKYNLYDTTLTQVGNGVPSVFMLKNVDEDAAHTPKSRVWNTASVWRAHSSYASQVNFGAGVRPAIESSTPGEYVTVGSGGLSGFFMVNEHLQKTIFFTTIKLSEEIITGLKNGTIEIIFTTYAENHGDGTENTTGELTGSFITLGKQTSTSGSWRDLDNFTTQYGNTLNDAYYQILGLDSNGLPDPNNVQTPLAGTGRIGNIYHNPSGLESGQGRQYFISKLGHNGKTYPNITYSTNEADTTMLRIGTYTMWGQGVDKKYYETIAGMYNMQLEVRYKGAVSVTVDNQQRQYGDPNPLMTATTATGLIGGDTVTSVTGSYNCDVTSPVGSYLGTVTGYTFTNGRQAYYDNVTIYNTGPTLTVTQRDVSITSQSLSKLYGAADPTHTYTVTSGSVVNGDTIGQITRASGETVNTYAYSLTSPNCWVVKHLLHFPHKKSIYDFVRRFPL